MRIVVALLAGTVCAMGDARDVEVTHANGHSAIISIFCSTDYASGGFSLRESSGIRWFIPLASVNSVSRLDGDQFEVAVERPNRVVARLGELADIDRIRGESDIGMATIEFHQVSSLRFLEPGDGRAPTFFIFRADRCAGFDATLELRDGKKLDVSHLSWGSPSRPLLSRGYSYDGNLAFGLRKSPISYTVPFRTIKEIGFYPEKGLAKLQLTGQEEQITELELGAVAQRALTGRSEHLDFIVPISSVRSIRFHSESFNPAKAQAEQTEARAAASRRKGWWWLGGIFFVLILVGVVSSLVRSRRSIRSRPNVTATYTWPQESAHSESEYKGPGTREYYEEQWDKYGGNVDGSGNPAGQ